MGYQDNPVWSTRKTSTTEVLSEDKYDEHIRDKKLIHLEDRDNIRYGVLKPVGHKKYTSHVTVNQFKRIYDIYNKQVKGIYIARQSENIPFVMNYQEKSILDSCGCNLIVCHNNVDSNNILAEVLRQLKD